MGLLELIKQAGTGAVEAGNPVALMFGTVIKTSPLEVNVEQRFTISEDFLIIPEQLTRYEIELNHHHLYVDGTTEGALTEPIVIRKGLENGDNLLLIRMQGGQRFIVLDKVVNT